MSAVMQHGANIVKLLLSSTLAAFILCAIVDGRRIIGEGTPVASLPLDEHNDQPPLRPLDNDWVTKLIGSTHPSIALRPFKCNQTRYGVPMFRCASHKRGNPRDWPCIRRIDLCNGIHDCPKKEDEHPTFCLFFLALSKDQASYQEMFMNTTNLIFRKLNRLEALLGDKKTPSYYYDDASQTDWI